MKTIVPEGRSISFRRYRITSKRPFGIFLFRNVASLPEATVQQIDTLFQSTTNPNGCMIDKEKQKSSTDQAPKKLSAQRTAWLKNDTTNQSHQNFHLCHCDPMYDDEPIHLSQAKNHTGQLHRQATPPLFQEPSEVV